MCCLFLSVTSGSREQGIGVGAKWRCLRQETGGQVAVAISTGELAEGPRVSIGHKQLPLPQHLVPEGRQALDCCYN